MSHTVAIDDLQVGMFVHLDLGWWAHPFALSSFLITSPEQITTIRRLGLRRLRWSPEKSRLADVQAEAGAATAVGDAPAEPGDPAGPEALDAAGAAEAA